MDLAQVTTTVPDNSVPIFSKEFWALLVLILTGTGGAVIAVGKWLANHIAEIQKSHATMVEQQQKDKTNQRDEFLIALSKREEVFAAVLEKRDVAFTQALLKIELDCGKQRELDRAQREEDRRLDHAQRDEDRRLLYKAIGLSGGDTGRFITEPRPSKTRPRPEIKREQDEAEAESG